MSKKITPLAVAIIAAAAIGFTAYAAGTGSSNGTSTAVAGGGPPSGGMPGYGTAGGAQAGAPTGGPGGGTTVTGAAYDKVVAAVKTKYKGTIERVEQLPDGSYVAHVVTDDGELHVAVSKAFKVTGLQQRPTGPPPGMDGTNAQGVAPQSERDQQTTPQTSGDTSS